MSYEPHIFCTECGAQAPRLHDHRGLTSYACQDCPAVLTYDGNEAVYHLSDACWDCDPESLEDNDEMP